MISLTDLALFNKINEITEIKGIFVPEDSAFRSAMDKYGDPQLPLFSLFWDTAAKDTTRYNRFAGAKGVQTAVRGSGLAVQKIKYLPVDVSYSLHVWHTDLIDLVDTMRNIFFFSVEAGGNGVTITHDELGLKDVGITLSMDLSLSIDRSSGTDQGNFFHGTIPIIAHTYFVEGLETRIIRKIMVDLYTYAEDWSEENSILQRTFEVRSDT